MRRLSFLVAFAALAFTLPVLAAPNAPRSNLGVITDVKLPSSIWNMPFTDSNGVTRTFGQLKGTTLLVPFLTLCPDVCPFTTGNAIQTARRLEASGATNVRVIEVTVDPQRDSVARLSNYRRMVGLRSSDIAISFWRTNSKNTRTMMKFFGMTTEKLPIDAVHRDWMTNKPISYELDHSDGFYVITDRQKLRFVSGLSARFVGKLTRAMKSYLNEEGLNTLAHPSTGWTPKDAVDTLTYISQSHG